MPELIHDEQAINSLGVPLLKVGEKFAGDPVKSLSFRKSVWQKTPPPVLPDSGLAHLWAKNYDIKQIAQSAKIAPEDLVAVALGDDVVYDPRDPLFVSAYKAWSVIYAGQTRTFLADLLRMGVPNETVNELAEFAELIKEKQLKSKKK